MKKVSVIVPCYNAAKSVTKTLDSLRNQTIDSLEVIAINDGSTDDTLQVLENYQKQYSDFDLNIYTKENEGIASARNYALTKVTGEYVGWLDSDDYTTETMFQDMYQRAKQDDLEVVVSNFLWISSKGEKLQKEGPYEVGSDMMINVFAVLWNKLYQRSFLQQLDFRFPDGDRHEDTYFLYCLACNVKKIGFIDQPYVHYVQNETSITHTNNKDVQDMIDVHQKILSYYRSHDLFDAYHDALEYIHIKSFLGNHFLRCARVKDKEESKKAILMGWNLLNQEFPNWKKNPYLKSLGGMKNRYFSIVSDKNIMFFAWIFRNLAKDNL